ncbi:UNVERIFIED_ORG: hypothetical protein J2W74_003925 [Methylorubrum zatmanii]
MADTRWIGEGEVYKLRRVNADLIAHHEAVTARFEFSTDASEARESVDLTANEETGVASDRMLFTGRLPQHGDAQLLATAAIELSLTKATLLLLACVLKILKIRFLPLSLGSRQCGFHQRWTL